VHLCNQIEAGAEVVQLFDSWAGVLTADGFQRWVVEPTAAIVRHVGKRFKKVPIIGFPRGAGLGYLEYAEHTGVSAVSLDSTISAEWAARVLQPLVPVQGNLDPLMLLAGEQPRNDATDRILRALGDGPFVFNLGHGVIKETAPEQVEELVQFVRTWQTPEID
jgi:uroporphyrinogen decarboxylase